MVGQTKLAVDGRSFESSAFANTSRFLLCLLFFPCVFIGCSKGRQSIALTTVRKVTVGIQVSPAMTLLMVAKDEGFFSRQGLDVELKEFTAGKFALQAFLGGSIDFAVSGDVPVCLAGLQGNQIRVVTQVVEKTINHRAKHEESGSTPVRRSP